MFNRRLNILMSLFALSLSCSAFAPAYAQRAEKPSGKEIAQRAEATKLQTDAPITTEAPDATLRFISAANQIKSRGELENGVILGAYEVIGKGAQASVLRRYNLFLTKVRDQWRAYIESNGQIVSEIDRVTVNEVTEMPKQRERTFRVEREQAGMKRTSNSFLPSSYLLTPGVKVSVCYTCSYTSGQSASCSHDVYGRPSCRTYWEVNW